MSEENTSNIVPAMLSEGEAVIPAHKVEEFKAAVEEILQASQEIAEETVVEETVVEETVVEEKVETRVEEVAAELNLDPKISVVEEAEEKNVISSSSQKRTKPSDFAAGITDVAGGVIGTGAVKRKPAIKQPSKPVTDRVAIRSTRNVSWVGVGKVLKGTNIVTQEQADKWLTRDHVTLVSPEEVAQEFGK